MPRQQLDPDALIDLIRQRRSIRSFHPDRPVPGPMVDRIIEAGVWAPTGTNQQELRFRVLSDPAVLKEFSRFKHIKTAPCVILIFADFANYYADYGPQVKYLRHKRPLPHVDTGLCMMNMLLMAESLGLNSVPLNISPSLYFRPRGRRSLPRRLAQALCVLSGRSAFGIRFFSRFCRDIGIDTRQYLPTGAIALGYGTKVVDLKRATHGKRPVMRKDPGYHRLEKI